MCESTPLWFIALAVFGAVTAVAIPGWLLLHYLAEKFANQQENENG